MELALKHNLSVPDTYYLQAAFVSGFPVATNDRKLRNAAEANHLATMTA